MIGPIYVYAHQDTDEVAEDYFSEKETAEWTLEEIEAAEAFLLTNPLYEVKFEFHLDLETRRARCVLVDLGDGRPFTRSIGTEQLTLFDKDE